MILPRILTAVVGIPLILYLIHVGGIPYLVLVVGLSVMALNEYATMLWAGGRGIQRTVTVAGGGLLSLAVGLTPLETWALPGLAPMVLTLVLLAALLSEVWGRQHSLDRAALTVFGAVFVGWTLGHLALIRELSPHGEALTLLLFLAVWSTDTFAYIVGMSMGRRRLAEVISPKKSWEGAAGGLAAALACVWAARVFFMDYMRPGLAVGLGLLVGTLGQLSDLGQSLVKRASGAKDSGTLLPGHGGVFDRMDSFLMLAPLYYYVWVAVLR